MKLTPDEQETARYGPENVDVEITGTTRWGVTHAVTFMRDGKLWQFITEDPATEMQDWVDCDLEAHPAEPYTVTRYRKVDQ